MVGTGTGAPAAGGRPARIGSAFELLLVLLGFTAITIAFFHPMSLAPGAWVYRPDNGDGQFSIWNVAWVAHALLDDPRNLLNANIFYPHTGTLAYSEMNLAAGALALPAYWATRSAYAAHNTAVLASFVLSGTSMYYLCRYLTHDRRASIVGAVFFAFCPHVIAHLLHIQPQPNDGDFSAVAPMLRDAAR